jgi:hypothetical protein
VWFSLLLGWFGRGGGRRCFVVSADFDLVGVFGVLLSYMKGILQNFCGCETRASKFPLKTLKYYVCKTSPPIKPGVDGDVTEV